MQHSGHASQLCQQLARSPWGAQTVGAQPVGPQPVRAQPVGAEARCTRGRSGSGGARQRARKAAGTQGSGREGGAGACSRWGGSHISTDVRYMSSGRAGPCRRVQQVGRLSYKHRRKVHEQWAGRAVGV